MTIQIGDYCEAPSDGISRCAAKDGSCRLTLLMSHESNISVSEVLYCKLFKVNWLNCYVILFRYFLH